MTSIEFIEQMYYSEFNGVNHIELFEKAKEMHKQEIENAYRVGAAEVHKITEYKPNKYYQETFVSKGSDNLEQVVNDYDDDPTWIDDEVEVPKQQETLYTEEQMKQCWESCERYERPKSEGYAPNFEQFIQSLKQPKK